MIPDEGTARGSLATSTPKPGQTMTSPFAPEPETSMDCTEPSKRVRLMRHFVAALGVFLAVEVGSSPARAATTSSVTATFTIDGHPVARRSDSNPIRLDPVHPARVTVAVTNRRPDPITVAAVVLRGRAFNITFFDFETQTALHVEPGKTETQEYLLDFASLDGQGDGLIPASVRLLDDHRDVLAGQNFTADVRGRITSLFGLFAVEVTVFTGIMFAGAVIALARGKLHQNRFRRALRFARLGVGVGVVVVCGFAVLRIFVPRPSHWLPIVLVTTAIGFGVGYLTPNQVHVEFEPGRDSEPNPGRAQPLLTDPSVTLTPEGMPIGRRMNGG